MSFYIDAMTAIEKNVQKSDTEELRQELWKFPMVLGENGQILKNLPKNKFIGHRRKCWPYFGKFRRKPRTISPSETTLSRPRKF